MSNRTMELTSLDQLDGLWEESDGKPVLIFKHSTRCPVSSQALAGFDRAREEDGAEAVRWVFLDLIAHRDCSDEVASRTGVPHKSPQAILLKNGKAVWNASHFDITAEALAAAAGG